MNRYGYHTDDSTSNEQMNSLVTGKRARPKRLTAIIGISATLHFITQAPIEIGTSQELS